jgi:hypothetical protein
MKCYIDKIRHFFITFTSRFENAHQVLKQHLRFFIDDLKMMMNNIEILLMNQRKKYIIKLNIAKMKMFFDFWISLFREFIFQISSHALRFIHKQFFFLQIENYFTICTNAWIIVSRLSYVHKIKKRMTFSQKMFLLKNIHSHWRFVKSVFNEIVDFDFILLIKESIVVKTRDRFMNFIMESFNQTNLMKEINSRKEKKLIKKTLILEKKHSLNEIHRSLKSRRTLYRIDKLFSYEKKWLLENKNENMMLAEHENDEMIKLI